MREVPIADEYLPRYEEEVELPAPQPHFVVVAWRGDPQPDTWSLLLQLCQ